VLLSACCKLGFDGPESTEHTERVSTVDALGDIRPFELPWKRSGEPQIDRPDVVFDGLAAVASDAFEGGVVLCRVKVAHNNKYDSDVANTAPDLSLEITFGGTRRSSHGPDDAWGATLSFGGVDVAKDAAIVVTLVDRDVGGSDEVGSQALVYTGRFPISLHTEAFEGECRAMPRSAFDGELLAKLATLDGALDAIGKACVPSRQRVHLGYPRAQIDAAVTALDAVAAYIGWEATELAAPRARFEKTEAACRDEVLAFRRATASELSGNKTITIGREPLTITLVKATCDAAERAAYGVTDYTQCLAELELADSEWPITVTHSNAVEGLEVALVSDGGEMAAARVLGLVRDGKLIGRAAKTDKTERILVVPSTGPSIGPDTLLWFETGGTAAILHVP
jgi:hypothetical protein